MIISRTPLRISFFGGGTDYPDYYLRRDGAVLGSTINKYVYVSLNHIDPVFDYTFRISYSKAELVDSVDQIVHPSVRECLRHHRFSGKLDVHIFTDLPARTGLGSSSSFTVGFLNALHALEGRAAVPADLAAEAIHVEQNLIEENVGSQDQVHAAFGGINVIEFSSSDFRVTPVDISAAQKERLQDSMLIFYTGETRHASEVVAEQMEKTRKTRNDKYLERMHRMVFEALDVIRDSAPDDMVRHLGTLLDEGWNLKKRLSRRVSTAVADDAYEAAMRAGAHGGKLLGAGGGGFLCFFVPADRQAAIRKAVNLPEVTVRFADTGTNIIYANDGVMVGDRSIAAVQ